MQKKFNKSKLEEEKGRALFIEEVIEVETVQVKENVSWWNWRIKLRLPSFGNMKVCVKMKSQ